jgi:peroxiredoxin
MLKKIVVNIAMLAAMLTLGFVIYYFFLSPNSAFNHGEKAIDKNAPQQFLAANLPNEQGINQALSQYKGKVLVVNFWATWCPPCREEMPELSELHTEYQSKNVVVLGVAIDDMDLVKAFQQATPVQYPLLVAEDDGMLLANQLGNDKGVLPYTLIIDQRGMVVQTYFGRVTKSQMTSALEPLL